MLQIFKLTLLLTIFTSQTNCEAICYDGYGCFTTEYPFSNSLNRPFGVLPQTPGKINTRFYLWNRKTSPDGETISRFNVVSSFDPALKTKFITHGFLDHGKLPWIIAMKDAFLATDNYNVISVDWSGGAFFPYTLATANTQVVGVEIALLITELQRQTGLSLNDVHLIGHSLGAHISGYCAKRFNPIQVARVTGLDPASPYFEGCPPIVRLDASDAVYVDIIHTNGEKQMGISFSSLGMIQAIGHVDYYPNGGLTQPGCYVSNSNVNPACSHLASQNYFTDSIRGRCQFTAFPCGSYADFKQGKCLKCEDGAKCNRMGLFSSQAEARGTLYLNTNNNYGTDLCVQPYQMRLLSADNGKQKAKGKFSVDLQTETENSGPQVFDNGGTEWKSDMSGEFLVNLITPLKESVQGAIVRYEKQWSYTTTYSPTWKFSQLVVFSGTEQASVKLCPVRELFLDGASVVEFKKCVWSLDGLFGRI